MELIFPIRYFRKFPFPSFSGIPYKMQFLSFLEISEIENRNFSSNEKCPLKICENLVKR